MIKYGSIPLNYALYPDAQILFWWIDALNMLKARHLKTMETGDWREVAREESSVSENWNDMKRYLDGAPKLESIERAPSHDNPHLVPAQFKGKHIFIEHPKEQGRCWKDGCKSAFWNDSVHLQTIKTFKGAIITTTFTEMLPSPNDPHLTKYAKYRNEE